MSNNSLPLRTIKLAITNQLAKEKQGGADERDLGLLRNVFADFYIQLENIVGEINDK